MTWWVNPTGITLNNTWQSLQDTYANRLPGHADQLRTAARRRISG